MKAKIRVATYCRVSTEKDDQLNSLESQKRYFADYINSRDDMELYKVYFDEGTSGTNTEKRVQFNEMIADAEKGRFDYILTKEVSRFARNTVDTLTYARLFKSMNIGIKFMLDSIDTLDSDGELRLTLMASIAQEESRKISGRVKWGQLRQMENGVVFGRDPLGYKLTKGCLSIIPDEAKVVQLIFHKYANENKGSYVIARELYEMGIMSKQGKQFSCGVILKIIKNEKYMGDLCQKKTFTPDYLDHKKKYNHGEEEMIYKSNHHEAIIDRETWDRAQAILASRKPTAEQKAKYGNRYWCSGKVICGECGEKFVRRNKTNSSYQGWRCYAAANHGRKKTDMWGNVVGCDNQSINNKVLLSAVAFTLSQININKEQIISEIMQEIRSVQYLDKPIDITSLQSKIGEIKKKKFNLYDSLADGVISKEDYKSYAENYDSQIEGLNRQIEDAKRQNEIIENKVAELNSYAESIRNILDFADPDEKVCGEVTESITVYSGHIIDVKLNDVPFALRMKYTAKGSGEHFRVEFEIIPQTP